MLGLKDKIELRIRELEKNITVNYHHHMPNLYLGQIIFKKKICLSKI